MIGRALALAALWFAVAAPAGAAETVALRYDLFASGLTVAEGSVRLTVDEGAYALRTDLDTKGLAAMLVGFSSRARSEGRLTPDPRPRHHAVDNVWRGDDRHVDLRWPAADAPPVGEVAPPAAKDDREPIPPAETVGALDPLSAIFSLVRGLARDGAATVTVFDGRRLYRLSADERTPHAVEAPAYGGPGWRARLRYERLGGRSRDSFFADSHKPVEAILDLAPGPAFGLDEGTPVPVRVVVQTANFGALVALLRATAADQQAALAEDAR